MAEEGVMTKAVKKPAASEAKDDGKVLVPTERLLFWPEGLNGASTAAWGKSFGEVDLSEAIRELHDKTKAVCAGDMQPVEAMLYGQAAALQVIFTNLSRRAANQEYLKQFQTHLTLALKAQAQCRATLEALAEIKNPRPVAFVGQANIANGPQQVNNGPAAAMPHAHADRSATPQNKLMDTRHEQRLDLGTQDAAGGADPVLETVGTGDRTED